MSLDTLLIKKALSEQLPRIKTIGDLARLVRTSPDALGKEFMRREAISLSRYIAEARIKRAKVLLMNSRMACKEICYAVGFRRADDGARSFKRYVGLSMEEFRKAGEIP